MSVFGRKSPRKADCFGPKDYRGKFGWEHRGVLADFDQEHDLEILVTDCDEVRQAEFGKTWTTDANDVIFKRGKCIMLYWGNKKRFRK